MENEKTDVSLTHSSTLREVTFFLILSFLSFLAAIAITLKEICIFSLLFFINFNYIYSFIALKDENFGLFRLSLPTAFQFVSLNFIFWFFCHLTYHFK